MLEQRLHALTNFTHAGRGRPSAACPARLRACHGRQSLYTQLSPTLSAAHARLTTVHHSGPSNSSACGRLLYAASCVRARVPAPQVAQLWAKRQLEVHEADKHVSHATCCRRLTTAGRMPP